MWTLPTNPTDVCGLQLPPNRAGNMHALYANASHLRHSCAPNCRLVFDAVDKTKTGRVIVKAVQEIAKGEMLTWAWSCQMHTTSVRLQDLAAVRNMRCECRRCLDPTELGSEFSTAKCVTCSGWVRPHVMPQYTNIADSTSWTCDGTCSRVIDTLTAISRSLLIEHDTTKAKSGNISSRLAKLEALLTKFSMDVHPNSFSMLSLKHSALVGHGENEDSLMLCNLSTEEVEKLAALGCEVLQGIEQFSKCVWRSEIFASDCLSVLADAEAEIMKRRLKSGAMDLNEARAVLRRCQGMLQRAIILGTYAETFTVETTRCRALAAKQKALQCWAEKNGLLPNED